MVACDAILTGMRYYKNLASELKKRATQGAKDSPELSNVSKTLQAREKELAALKKEKEDLEKARTQALKEKEELFVRGELTKTAKKLNVRENAIEPVLSLIGSKFSAQEGKVVFADKPESDLESVMKEWLGDKDYFLAPQVAPSAGLTPNPSGPLPSKEHDLSSEQGIAEYLRSRGPSLKKR